MRSPEEIALDDREHDGSLVCASNDDDCLMPPLVFDRPEIAYGGMAGVDNPVWLRQSGRRHIIGAPSSDLKRLDSERAAGGWRTV